MQTGYGLPEEGQWRLLVIHEAHCPPIPDSHRSINRTMESLQGEYYWPNMRDQVKQYIRDCLPCQRLEANRQDQRTQRRITRQEIEREWEVERIVDSRHVGRNKRLQYRVQWVGWPHGDGTWYNTDRDEFGHAEELAVEFHDRHPEKPR